MRNHERERVHQMRAAGRRNRHGDYGRGPLARSGYGMTDAPTTRADHAELAACPFCGGTAKAITPSSSAPYVLCCRCHAGGPVSSSASLAEAVSSWNRRASDQAALLSEIAALRGERDAEIERHGETFEKFRQAERQRDEAVGLLREWHPATREAYRDHSLEARTEAFLANQGTDHAD